MNSKVLKLAHQLKGAYSSFATALRIAYAIVKDKSGRTLRKIRSAMGRIYTMLDKIGETLKADKVFTAFCYLLDLPKLPALR